MKIDTSEIQNASCFVINSSSRITGYNSYNYRTYDLFGNKWFHSSSYSSSYNLIPSNAICKNLDFIKNLPSPYDYNTPYYYNFAFYSLIFIFYFAYRLILHPWWRKKL